MAASSWRACVVFQCIFVWSLRCISSTSLPPMCRPPPPPLLQSTALLLDIQSKCPLSFSFNSPLQVSGLFVDRTLTSKRSNAYTSVLFYASWCPFSHDARLAFEALSSMYPQIEHLAVEQSSVVPSIISRCFGEVLPQYQIKSAFIFSRYGIHSLPAILMVNQSSRTRFHGSNDLHSLVKFYKQNTGFEPVHYVTVNQSTSSESRRKFVLQSWRGSSLNEILTMEPYLLFSMLFLSLRALVFISPKVLSRFRAFWVLYIPHLNLEIFGETSQILGCILHLINVKRIWAKLRLCKVRNFHEGTKNARVWASSLASVSLGEASSLRSSS